jgi:hypothetical protein
VRDACARQVMQVNQAMPTVVFEVKTTTGQELTDVKVSMDGEPIATRLEGTAISLDPGEHQFTFEAAGQPPLTKTLVIHEGEKDRHESVVLGGAPQTVPAPTPPSAPAPSPSPASPAPTAVAPSPPPPTDAAPQDGGNSQRTWGLVVGGVSVAGLAVGSIFGLMATSSWSSATSGPTGCPSKQGCSQQAINDRSSALTSATISTISFVAGGVLLAGGAVLYFTAPKHGAEPGPTVGLTLGPGAVGATGTF